MNSVDVRVPINGKLLSKFLSAFIRNEVTKVGINKVVVGLSGGVDSSVSAILAANALGPENVLGIRMPYKTSSKDSFEHAEAVQKVSGINMKTVWITPQVDAYFEQHSKRDPKSRGNKMARERMTILYDYSADWNALVLGTSNKTELFLGYGTIFGDSASALNPLGDLFKTQVWDLARYIGVPDEIIDKPPSADLWEGQTDEEELGFTYSYVDKFLYCLLDLRYDRRKLIKAGFPAPFTDKVIKRVNQMHFKRVMPLVAKISKRTMGWDYLVARDYMT